MKRQATTIVGVWLLAAAPLWAGTPINETKDAPMGGEVEVSNVAGSVEVTGWKRGAIEITGTLGDGTERLDFIRDGDLTTIKVVLPDEGRSEGSDLKIKVPLDSSLSISVVSADVNIEGVTGRHGINAVSGDVDAALGGGDGEISTVSGDIDVRGSRTAGELRVTAVSGDLQIVEVVGELYASTVSGDIDVAKSNLGRVKLATTNGDIDLQGIVGPSGEVDIDTTNGDVDVQINGKDDINLKVDTFNGDIDNCFRGSTISATATGPAMSCAIAAAETSAGSRCKP